MDDNKQKHLPGPHAARFVVSRPLTARFAPPLDTNFRIVVDEGPLLWRLGNSVGRRFSQELTQLVVLYRLLRERGRADVVVAGRYGDVFALFQALVPFGRRPLMLMDTEWFLHERSPMRARLVKAVRRFTARGACAIQVFCEAEALSYSEYFGIPLEKFVWVPYCAPTDEIPASTSKGDYIFCGGLHDRDWQTFYLAVRDLPVEVRVRAPVDQIPRQFVASNMSLLGTVSREQYFAELAGSMLVALSVTPIIRFPGVITYVYAMLMGKCVVVNDPVGAPSYIEDGVTGMIVPNRDSVALETAIRRLLDNEEKRTTIGRNAQLYAQKHFSPDVYWSRVSEVGQTLLAV